MASSKALGWPFTSHSCLPRSIVDEWRRDAMDLAAAHARACLETAKLIGSEADKPDEVNFNHVAAGNAVLAAIAASDALCCKLLGE